MANANYVKFKADGIAEREVMYCRYELDQKTDVEGQPTGPVRGGKIYVKVKSKDDGSSDLMEWMCGTHIHKGGSISFPNHEGGEMKHLDFVKGFMVEYSETYDDSNNVQQYEEFCITCKEITVGGANHNNRWTNY